MNERNVFWNIVNHSINEKNKEEQRQFIFNALLEMSTDEILSFAKVLNEIEKETREHENFIWAFRLANIGDSFDSECYFSSWLVSLGEEKRKEILANPLMMTKWVGLGDNRIENYKKVTHELFSYIPYEALEVNGK